MRVVAVDVAPHGRALAQLQGPETPQPGKLLVAALLLCGAGCASTSIGDDVARVQELTRVESMPRVADGDVDPAASEAARELLARPLDAEAAVRVALLNNRELRANLREMGALRGRYVQAGVLPNPVFEAELEPEHGTPLALGVEYAITRAVLAPLRARAARTELEAARYRAAASVVDLGLRVRVAVFGLQAAEERSSLARLVLEGYAADRDTARAILKAGNTAELDAATREAAYARAQVSVLTLDLEVMTAREQLGRLLGLDPTTASFRVAGKLAAVPAQPPVPGNAEQRAVGENLELKEMRERLLALRDRAGVTRTAGWLPDVTVGVRGQEAGEPSSGVGSEPDWHLGGGVRVQVPLFDRNQGTAAALDAEGDALLERFHGRLIELRSAAREVSAKVRSAHARARHYQEHIAPAQRRVSEQTLLQYNAMQIGIFQLLEAHRQELLVELGRVETLREYWSAVAELDALLAGKHPGHDAPGGKAPAATPSDFSSSESPGQGGH